MKTALVPTLLLSLMCLSCPLPVSAGSVADLPGDVRQETIRVKGLDRTYLAFIPTGVSEKPPLILVLHGALGTGSGMRETCASQFDRLAVRERCIVVYPDGYKKHWNDCRTTPGDAAHQENIDDVGFITAIIDDCREKWHADPERVYAAGLSNGGYMCFRLAMEVPERIAGIAAMGAAMPEPEVSKCAPPRPGTPVVIMSGTEDPISPFEGGMVKIFHLFKRGRALSSLASARLWLTPENREKDPVREKLPDRDPKDETTIERLTWPNDRVALYVIHGGGHTVPGGDQYMPGFVVGRVSKDMDPAQEIWRFFLEHPKHAAGAGTAQP